MTNPNAVNYRDIGDVPLAVITALLTVAKSPMVPTLSATYAAVTGNTALFFAQAWMENQWETTGIVIRPEDHNPVSLRPWAEDPTATVTGDLIDSVTRAKVGTIKVPPGAIGAILEPDKSMMLRFSSDAAGAREWQRRIITDPTYKNAIYVKAITLEQMIDIYCPPGDIHPVTGNDANATYAPTVRAKLAEFAAAEAKLPPPPTQASGGIPMTYSTVIPGLPGGPLTTLVPVNLKIVPASHTLQRPGIKAESPRRSVQHGNGNPNSTAAGEATYLYNGADGRQASYHSAVDDTSIWFMIPADEVTWQAADGAGPGNMSGFSCEQVEDDALWANPTRRDACIRNAADWMGRISARLSIAKPEQHWDFNASDPDRHDCPNKLRHVNINGRSAWDIYVDLWNAAKADELKLMGGLGTGHVTPPPTTYARTSPIAALKDITVDKNNEAPGIVTDEGTDFVYVADVIEAINDTRRLQAADAKAKDVGPKLAKGERFIVTWLFKAKDGNYYYLTPFWTRVAKADTKRISDAPVVADAA